MSSIGGEIAGRPIRSTEDAARDRKALHGKICAAEGPDRGSSDQGDHDEHTESIEDVEPSEWTEKVYKPDIIGKSDTLYKEPGYSPR
jgi:4-oxalocrotonate tautomerase